MDPSIGEKLEDSWEILRTMLRKVREARELLSEILEEVKESSEGTYRDGYHEFLLDQLCQAGIDENYRRIIRLVPRLRPQRRPIYRIY